MTYKCPLCGSALSESHYHKVLKVQQRKERVQKSELDKLRKQALAAKKKERELRAKAKKDIETAKKEVMLSERKKTVTRNKRLIARIKKLEEEKKMLQKHTSPQQIGLADETVLAKRLQREFPDDRIEHAGKAGDVLHFVMFGAGDAGCIVYECKRTDRISASHVKQTAEAKRTRQANYGILVTTGTRRGFSGLDQDSGIFVVAQAGVLALAHICRDSLIMMAQEQLEAAAKQAAARRLMDYVTSPTCKTPLEQAISHAEQAHKHLVKEVKRHFLDWKKRHELYQSIHYDVSHVRTNIARVLEGEDPLKLEKPKHEPLALPGVNE